MSEKPSAKVGVRTMREEIATIAGPRDWGDTRESWLARVPRRVPSVSFRTVKALFYGEITDANHWAAHDIRRAAAILDTQKELRRSRERNAILAQRLDILDSEFHGPSIAAHRELAAGPRREDHGSVVPEVRLGSDPPGD